MLAFVILLFYERPMRRSILKFSIGFSLLVSLPLCALAKIYKKGNPNDVATATHPILCLAGGESDDLWVEGWKVLLKASGGGDVVIVRADAGIGTYESWILNDEGHHNLPKVNSVTTLALTSPRDAFRPEAENAIRQAELIFFDGGDQSLYLKYIQGSPLEKALEYALHDRKTPMGGTSAGMAILGGIDFTAKYSPSPEIALVTSDLAMSHPTAQFLDLDRRTLSPPYLEQVITDTHFSERERQGRLISFMARAVYNRYADVNGLNIKGIGADGGAAYCYNTTTGQGKVFGIGRVHFLVGNTAIEKVFPGHSLDWFGQRQAIKVYSIHGSQTATASFNVSTWTGIGGTEKFWFVDGSNPVKPVFGESE